MWYSRVIPDNAQSRHQTRAGLYVEHVRSFWPLVDSLLGGISLFQFPWFFLDLLSIFFVYGGKQQKVLFYKLMEYVFWIPLNYKICREFFRTERQMTWGVNFSILSFNVFIVIILANYFPLVRNLYVTFIYDELESSYLPLCLYGLTQNVLNHMVTFTL